MRYVCDAVSDLAGKKCLPYAVAVLAYAIFSMPYGLWGAFTLIPLCWLSVIGARLLCSCWVGRCAAKPGQQPQPQQPQPQQRSSSSGDRNMGAALLVLLVVQFLVSPQSTWLVLHSWYLLLVIPLLAPTLHYMGTPSVLLEEVLSRSQNSYAQGAAWAFFIGYLQVRFGYNHGTLGERDAPSFRRHMQDYLSSNEVQNETRDQTQTTQTNTCMDRMIILIPMNYAAVPNDSSISEHDQSVQEELKLPGRRNEEGRTYGEIQVYTISSGGRQYRAAMEVATPVRTAFCAVDDAHASFEKEQFDQFARQFHTHLQDILDKKPTIGKQILLVPIADIGQIGSTVIAEIQRSQAAAAPTRHADPADN